MVTALLLPWDREQWFLHDFFSANPIPDRRHPQQPTGYHAVLVGLPVLLLPGPSPPERETEGRVKGKEHSIRPGPGLTAPPSPLPPPTRTRIRFHLPLASPPVAGAPDGVSSDVEGAAAPCTLRGAEGDLYPSLRPRGPLACAHPFKFGWGML